MKSIGKELAKRAKQNGICQEWHKELKTTEDKDKLLEMYVSGIDFCLANNYPSNDYIRENFVGMMEKHGVHLDEDLKCVNDRTVVALGKCTGSIEINGFTASEVFIKHESKLILLVEDNAFVMLDMFDDSELVIIAKGNAKVCVNRYGGKVESISDGENTVVKIKEKDKKTY